MSYNFETYSPKRGHSYYGGSVKKNSIYLAKMLREDLPFDHGDRVRIDVDQENNAIRLTLDDNGFLLSENVPGSGLTISGGQEEGEFADHIGVEFGRYDPEYIGDDHVILKYDPNL